MATAHILPTHSAVGYVLTDQIHRYAGYRVQWILPGPSAEFFISEDYHAHLLTIPHGDALAALHDLALRYNAYDVPIPQDRRSVIVDALQQARYAMDSITGTRVRDDARAALDQALKLLGEEPDSAD